MRAFFVVGDELLGLN